MERGNIGKDSLKLTISQMAAFLIGMISTMLLSRFRTLAEYGTYSQMYLIAGIFTPILMMGVPYSLSYFLPRADSLDDKRKILSQNLIATTVLGVLTMVVIFILKDFLVNYFTNPMLGSLIVIVAIFPWTRTINNTVQHFLVIYNRTSWFLAFRIIHSLTILIAVIITLSFKLDFGTYMIMFIVVELIFCSLVYLLASRVSGGLVLYFNKELMLKMLKYSLPVGLSGTIGSINRHIDQLVIGRFFSTQDLAIYVNAARELPLKLLGVSIATALLPRIVLMFKEKKIQDAVELWKESIKVSYVFMCYFTTVLFVYAAEIITILYSEKYLPGVPVFKVYSIIMLFNVTYFYMIISSMGKTKYILYTTLASIGLNIVLSILFYNLMGFIGPAVATLVSFTAFRIGQLIITVRLTEIEFKNIFPWKSIGLVTVVNIAFGIVFTLLGRVVHLEQNIGQIAESIIFGAVWLIVYIGIYFKYIKKKWHILNKGSVEKDAKK